MEFDPNAETYTSYCHDPKDPRSLGSNDVASISGEETRGLWVGTYDRGVDFFDKASRKFTHYVHDEKDPGSLSSNGVQTVLRERSGALWVSTINRGVNKLNRPKPLFTKYLYENKTPVGFRRRVFEDRSGNLLISISKGWDEFDPKAGTFTFHPLGKGMFLLAEDLNANLWIGLDSGGVSMRDRHDH